MRVNASAIVVNCCKVLVRSIAPDIITEPGVWALYEQLPYIVAEEGKELTETQMCAVRRLRCLFCACTYRYQGFVLLIIAAVWQEDEQQHQGGALQIQDRPRHLEHAREQ